LRILYLGPFEPAYGRNRVLLRGLESAGVETIIVNSKSPSRLRRYMECQLGARRHATDVDVIVMGARGDYYGQPLLTCRQLLDCRVIAFDAVLSLYETLVVDRGQYGLDSVAAKLLHMLDEIAFRNSEIIITDTVAHARYFATEFGLPTTRLGTVYVGTDDSIFYPRPKKSDRDTFLVGFWGGFIPLQGVENIIRAAKLLSNQPDIKFVLLGRGQTWTDARSLAGGLDLRNVRFDSAWTPYQDLAQRIATFDLCLGIFGTGPKALRVVPNKAFETIAMGLPLVTADTAASREVFTNEVDSLLISPGDPRALADAILELKSNDDLRRSVALNGYSLFKKRFTPEAIGKAFLGLLTSLKDNI
jgi:glycosyltransferase involved in cell wall biosynthesis